MSQRKIPLFLILTATLNLSACSYIQSLFPDKEKEYQFTTEIPPLVLPEDLSKGAAGKATESTSVPESEPLKAENQQTAETDQAEAITENSESSDKIGTEPAQRPEEAGEAIQQEQPEQQPEAEEEKYDKDDKTPVELVRFSDGERRLRISSSLNRAWHLVSKALSRNAIEVTQRDQDQKLFFVQYDPDASKAEDGSLLDEAIFLFKGFEANEKAYLLKLIPVDGKTDLAITDKDVNPVPNDEAAVKLLRLLGGTIQGN
jgi:outer membrane protein assembly factor BamC